MTTCVTALIKRKAGITREQFLERWGNHAKLFTNMTITKKNIVQYQQFHVLPQLNQTAESYGASIAQFDGVVRLHIEKLEDLFELLQSDEYREVAVPDELTFLDRDATLSMVGEIKLDVSNPFSQI